jgi:hypothetical protein
VIPAFDETTPGSNDEGAGAITTTAETTVTTTAVIESACGHDNGHC